MSDKRVHLFVSGRVQGVNFRGSTRVQAQRLGVVGWIRNLQDGRVEAVAQGDSAALDRFVEFVSAGPPGSKVLDVEISDQPISGSFPAFEVVR